MSQQRLFVCFSAMAASAVLAAGPANGQVYESAEHSYQVVTVAEGLENPWSIAFLPGGDMLVTERPGRLRLVHAGGHVAPDPIAGVPEVWARGQGGLLDVVPHPDFATNRLVYLSYSKPGDAGATTAVIRGEFDGSSLRNVEQIFEADAWAGTPVHFGSRLVFDGDYLFITVGDRGARPELGTGDAHPAQNLDNHQGSVIRLHHDGSVPSDNPFVGMNGANPEVWSYGHRNLQGLARHPETGDLWNTEHGPQGGDELNRVVRGANFGWPVIGYGVNYGGAVIHEGTAKEGMMQPAHYWVPSIATSGLAFYSGDAFPEWRGDAFVGGLAGQHLAHVEMDGDRAVSREELLSELGERIRDVRSGPDGFLYVLTDNAEGRVLRLQPAM